MVWDNNMEPTAADHGDVLYNIGDLPELFITSTDAVVQANIR